MKVRIIRAKMSKGKSLISIWTRFLKRPPLNRPMNKPKRSDVKVINALLVFRDILDKASRPAQVVFQVEEFPLSLLPELL